MRLMTNGDGGSPAAAPPPRNPKGPPGDFFRSGPSAPPRRDDAMAKNAATPTTPAGTPHEMSVFRVYIHSSFASGVEKKPTTPAPKDLIQAVGANSAARAASARHESARAIAESARVPKRGAAVEASSSRGETAGARRASWASQVDAEASSRGGTARGATAPPRGGRRTAVCRAAEHATTPTRSVDPSARAAEKRRAGSEPARAGTSVVSIAVDMSCRSR